MPFSRWPSSCLPKQSQTLKVHFEMTLTSTFVLPLPLYDLDLINSLDKQHQAKLRSK